MDVFGIAKMSFIKQITIYTRVPYCSHTPTDKNEQITFLNNNKLQLVTFCPTQLPGDEEELGKSDASRSDVTKSGEEEKVPEVDNLQPGDDRTSPALDDPDPVLTLENPNPPVSKDVLQEIDLTPFIR